LSLAFGPVLTEVQKQVAAERLQLTTTSNNSSRLEA